jgi:hypothetical protein
MCPQAALQQQEDSVASLQQDIGEAVTHAEWQHSRIHELEAELRLAQVCGSCSMVSEPHAACTMPPCSDLLSLYSPWPCPLTGSGGRRTPDRAGNSSSGAGGGCGGGG